MKAHGLTTGLESEMDNLSMAAQPINMFQVQSPQHQQQQQQQQENISLVPQQQNQLVGLLGNNAQIDISQLEEFMDDGSPMASDPMMSSAPVSPSQLSESNDML